MTRKFNFLCTLSLLILFSTLAVAQPDANPTSEEGVMQQTEETKGKYPERPNDMWELGLNVGHTILGGDVFPNFPSGFGAGFHVRRALGYTLSLRGGYTFHRMSGSDFYTSQQTLTRNRAITELGYSSFLENYQTTLQDINLELLVNLNNLKFHKSTSKWGWYAGAGLSYHFYNVKHDALDKNNNNQKYDYTELNAAIAARNDVSREDMTIVNRILDGEYETAQSTAKNFEIPQSAGLSIVTGVSYKINEKINVSFDNKIIFSLQDNLDGVKTTLSNSNNDLFMYNNLRLNFNLGDAKKQSEPLYWLNPLDGPYDMIANNTQRLDNLGNLLADQDGDGVPDKLDKEANTPAGAIVNTKGETLDSDGDGVADYLDKQPFSEPGKTVDANGVYTPTNPGYVTKQEVEKMAKNNDWKNKPVSVNTNIPAASASSWFLPMIHFDNNSAAIKPTYYAQLHHVATVMQKNPSITVVVQGHASATSSVQHNLGLSQRRAENAAKFLSENYGISSSRLVIKYDGEAVPLKGANPSNYMNRRVEFSVQ